MECDFSCISTVARTKPRWKFLVGPDWGAVVFGSGEWLDGVNDAESPPTSDDPDYPMEGEEVYHRLDRAQNKARRQKSRSFLFALVPVCRRRGTLRGNHFGRNGAPHENPGRRAGTKGARVSVIT